MGDSIEDLKNVVAQTLETKGVLAQIRAELRKHVFLAIEEQENTSNPSHLANPKIAQIQATPTDHLVLDLIREFCDYYGLDHTLSVMQAEAKLSSRPRSRKLLADSLHLPIVGTHPLLYDIIQRDRDHGEEKSKTSADQEKKISPSISTTSTSTPIASVSTTTSSVTTSSTIASTPASTTASTTSTTTSTPIPSLAPLAKKPLGGLSPLPSLMPTSSTSTSTSSPSLLSSTSSSSSTTTTSSASSVPVLSNVPSMPTHPPPILSPTSANKPKKTVRFDASRDEAQEAPPIPSEDEESMDDIKPTNDRRKPVDVSSVTASLQTQAAQASTTMSTLTSTSMASTSMASTSSTSSSLSGTSLTSLSNLGRLGGPLPKLGPLPTITKQPLPSVTPTHDDKLLEDSTELDAADQKRLEEIEQKLKKLDEQDKGLKQVTTDEDEYGEDFAMEEEVGEEIDIDISTGEAEEEHGQQRQILDNSGDFSAGEDSYDQNFNDPKQNTQSYTDTSDVYSQDASVHDSFEESFDYVEPVEPI